MAKDHQSVKCVRDIRDYPWQCYQLSDDGRKTRALAEQRRMLATQLATHADGDGTSILVGITRLMTNLGWPKRTLYRRMEDLRRLGLLSETDGRLTERGTAVRSINVSALKIPGAGVPDSTAGVPDTEKRECQIAGAGVPLSTAGVPDSIAGVPRMRGTQPTNVPAIQTDHTTDGAGGWLQKHAATMGTPGKKQVPALKTMAANHGTVIVSRAVELLIKRGLGNATNPWAIFLAGATGFIEQASREKTDAQRKAREDEIIEANIKRQQAEEIAADKARWEKQAREEVGGDPNEYLAELEKQS